MRQPLILSLTIAIVVMVVAVMIISAPDPVGDSPPATSTPDAAGVFVPTATSVPPTPTPPVATALPTNPAPTATAPAGTATSTTPAASTVEPTSGPTMTPEPVQIAQEPFVDEEVVVKLFTALDLEAVAADHQLDIVPLGQFGSRPIFRMRVLDGSDPDERAAALQADPRVEYAEPNLSIQPPEWRSRYSWAKFDDEGNEILPWAPDVMRLPEAHGVTTGSGVTVAVLDTGIDTSHPAFDGKLAAGFDFVDFDDDPSEMGGYSDETPAYGHGTHVSGLILQAAPDARVMPVRVLDPQGNGNVWVLAEAIAWAVDPDGDPATPDGANVINLSLSTQRRTSLLEDIVREVSCFEVVWDDDDDDDDRDDDDSFDGGTVPDDDDDDDWDDNSDDAWDDDDDDDWDDDDGRDDRHMVAAVSFSLASNHTCSTERAVVVVAAAGNRGDNTPEYPAAEPVGGLLSVAASDRNDQLYASSSFGDWVDVAAPGVDIVSAMPEGDFSAWSGTSMATALTSGQVALVMSMFPQMTPEDVVTRIRQTAVPISAEVPWRIDAAAAVGVGTN